MTDAENQKIYAGAIGWEDKIDAEAEAKRIADYIATHVACAHGHHRPMIPNVYTDPCPVEGCGTRRQYRIEPVDVPKSLR
jgi:hypothetical protein